MAKRLKDFDSGLRAQQLQAGMWALGISATIGPVLGGLLADRHGIPLAIGATLGAAAMFSFVYGVTRLVSGQTADAVGKIYHPSGASTPPRREYSKAEALTVQGQYEAAIAVYEAHLLDDPTDPEPYMRLARIYRDRLDRPQDALSCFLRARREAVLTEGQILFLIQEIVELYIHRLDEPRRAIPELSELCWRFPDSPAVPGARRELEALREMVRVEHGGGATVEDQHRARRAVTAPEVDEERSRLG